MAREPSVFLDWSDASYFDKGIINDYRELTELRVTNKAKWAIGNITGEVDWLHSNGGKFASVPFTLKGTVPSGATQKFTEANGTLSSRTIEGAASKVVVRFTGASVIEAKWTARACIPTIGRLHGDIRLSRRRTAR